MVLIVVEEAREGGVGCGAIGGSSLVSTKIGEAMEEYVPFGDAAVEAEVPLLLFLEFDLLKAFGKEMESEEPREECVFFVDRL